MATPYINQIIKKKKNIAVNCFQTGLLYTTSLYLYIFCLFVQAQELRDLPNIPAYKPNDLGF